MSFRTSKGNPTNYVRCPHCGKKGIYHINLQRDRHYPQTKPDIVRCKYCGKSRQWWGDAYPGLEQAAKQIV